MTLGSDTSGLRTVDDDVSEGFKIRFLEVEDESSQQLSPSELVEKAVALSGENEGSVYYDGGTAFMSVSSAGPDDLSDLLEGVQKIVTSMKEDSGEAPRDIAE